MAYTYKEFLDLSANPQLREVEVFQDTVPATGAPPASWLLLNEASSKTDPYGRRLLVFKRSA